MENPKNKATVICEFWFINPNNDNVASTEPLDENDVKEKYIEHLAEQSIRMGLFIL